MNKNTFLGDIFRYRMWIFLVLATVWLVTSCDSSSISPQSQIRGSKKIGFIKGLTLQNVDREGGRVIINWRMHQDEGGVDPTVSYKVYVETNHNGVWVEDSSSVSTWGIDGTGDMRAIIPDSVSGDRAVDVPVPEDGSLVSGTQYQVVVEARDVDGVVARSSLNLIFSSIRLPIDARPKEVIVTNELDSNNMIVDWDPVADAQSYVITATEDASRLFGTVEVDTKIEVVCEGKDSFCQESNLAKGIVGGKLRWEVADLKMGSKYKVIVVPVVLEDLIGLRSVDEEGEEVSFEEEVERLSLIWAENIETKPGETLSEVIVADGVIPVRERLKEAAGVDPEVDGSVAVYTMKVKSAKAVDILEEKTKVSETDIYVAWSHGEGADGYGIVIREGEELVEGKSNYISRSDGAYVGSGFTTFTGLTASTSYTVEVISYSGGVAGESTTSEEITTLASGGGFVDPTPIRATNLLLTNPASGMLRISWDVAEEDSVTGYNIFYYRDSKPEKPRFVAERGETDHIFEVEPGRYKVQVDVLGTSVVPGEEKEVKVYATPRSPENVRVVFEEPKSVEDFGGNLYYKAYDFSFSGAVNDRDAGGFKEDLKYYYSYRRSSDSDWVEEKEIAMDSRGRVVAIVDDGSEDSLSSQIGQEYEIKVVASNTGGFSSATSKVFVFRSFPAPILFSDLREESGHQELTVSWDTPSDDRLFSSPLSGYSVVVTRKIDNVLEQIFEAPVAQVDTTADQRSVTITNLENNVEYIVYVFTVSEHGQSLSSALGLKYGFGLPGYDRANNNNVLIVFGNYFGNDLRVFTPQGHPEPVEGVTATPEKDGSVSVSWVKAGTGSPADSYEVDYITLSDEQAIEFFGKTDLDSAEGDYGNISWTGAIGADSIDVDNLVATFDAVPEDRTNVYRVRALREGGRYESEYVYYAKGLFTFKVTITFDSSPAGDTIVYSPTAEHSFTVSMVTNDGEVPDGFNRRFSWATEPEGVGIFSPVGDGDGSDDKGAFTFKVTNAHPGEVTIIASSLSIPSYMEKKSYALAKADYPGAERPFRYRDVTLPLGGSMLVNPATAVIEGSSKVSLSAEVISGGEGLMAIINAEDQLVLTSIGDEGEYEVEVTYEDANYVTDKSIYKVGVKSFTAVVSIGELPDSGVTSHSVAGLEMTAAVVVPPELVSDQPVNFDPTAIRWSVYPIEVGGIEVDPTDKRVATFHISNAEVGIVVITAAVENYEAFNAISNLTLEKATYDSGQEPIEYPDTFTFRNDGNTNKIFATSDNRNKYFQKSLDINSAATGFTWELNEDGSVSVSSSESGGTEATIVVSYSDYNYVDHSETITVTATDSRATKPVDSSTLLIFSEHSVSNFKVEWTAGTSGLKADGVTTAPITNYVVEWGTSVNTYASAENAGLTNSYVINKLNTGTQYFVRVRAMADSDDQDAIYSDGKSGDTYVLSAPAAPRSFATGDVSSNSISFTWVAPVDTGKASTGDATLSGYRFEYKLTNSNTWEDISSVTTGVGVRLTADLSGSAATGVTVEGLLGKTGYDFRISAKNSVDLYGEVASITVGTTSGATSPGDSVNVLTFTGHATNGFTVNWGVGTSGLKADGVTAAPITNYVVEWGTSVNTYASAENAGLTNSYVINKLNTGTQYFVRVRAMADSDDQDAIYSDGKSGDTYVLSAPAAPRSFATGDVSSNSISFTWVAPVDTGKASTGDATLSGYRFEYKLTNSTTWEDISSVTTGVGVRLTADLSGSAATGVTVEGLLGKTGYDFRISAKNSVDLYGEVASITVGTTSGATSPGDSGDDLTFTGHATNGFTVNWGVGTSGLKADGVTAAPITNYVVEWGTSVNTYASAENAGLTNSYVINKLNTGIQYFVRVRAMADSDDQDAIYSDGKSGDTYVLSAPAAPTSFATGDVSSNSISFTWVAPVDTGKASTGDATLSGYRFEYKLTNSTTWEDISSVTTGVGVRLTADLSGSAATGVTVEGLRGKTGYDFRISAKNSVDLYGEVASITVGTTSGATVPGDGGDDLTFTGHATNGFTVNWGVGTSGLKADGVTAAPITNYVVEWGTSVNTYASAENAGLTNSYVINKLNTGIQYFVRVRAMADSDDQDAIYSDGKSGDTYVLSAPAAPRSFATGDISSNSISFTWVAPVDTGKASTGDATLSGYRFEYKLTNSNTWEDISSVTTGVGVRLTADLSGSAATGVTVEGLQAMTGYDFRISAKNSVDLYGEVASITVGTTSGATSPGDSGDDLTFTGHATNGFTVNWGVGTSGLKADGVTAAPITNYVVEWGTSVNTYASAENAGLTNSYVINKLNTGTQYFVRVRAMADSDDENKIYSDGKSGDTYVLSAPAAPTSFATGDISSNSISFTWVAPVDTGKASTGDATLSGYRFEYKLTNSTTWEDISSVTTGVGVRLTADLSGDSAATGVTVEGLQAMTGYDFRISAKNSVDLYGEVASITVGTTSGATSPGDSVNVLTFTGHATNGFTVNWGVGTSGLKADGVTAAPITNYVVEWGTSVNTYASAENAGLTNSYVINKLNTGTQYFVRVRAMADSDDQDAIYSDGKSGDTYVLSAPAAPTSFATGDISSNSISFTWVAPVDTGKASTGDATLSGYRFEYKLTNSNTWEDISSVTTGVGVRLTADLSGSAATGVTVEGLLGKTGYDFRISAKNSVDLYGEVASITVGTTSGATSPGDSGDDLTFTGHATNGFTVNWGVGTSGLKADGVTAAPITNYLVEWGTSVNTYASAENAGLTNSYVINKLNTGTQYFVRVRAMADSDDENKIYSDGKSGDTYVLSAPAAPTSFATGDVSSNSISFTWVAPVDTGKASTGDATLSGYRFEYKLTNSNTWEDISSVTTGVGVRLTADLSGSAATGVTVEGLLGKTGYDFRISAKNSVGLYGEVASITVGTTSGATSPGDSGDDLTFTGHATNGFTVNWGVGTSGLKADGVTAAPITNYVVEWGTSVNTYASAENAGLTNSYVINKLNTGTQYFVRVRAMADSDDQDAIYSDGKSGDTYVLSAPAAPTSFATGDVSSNSISFTWVAPVDTGKASTGDATLSGYRFEYKLTNSTTWEDISSVTTGVGVRLTADLSGSAATGVTVEGLRGKTGYDFRISAKNSVDLYGEVASITVGTTSGATSPGDGGDDLTFTGHATNGFTVNWGVGTSGLKADGVTAAPITNYVVEWGTSVNTYASAENAGLTNSYVINKLNTGIQYFVRVRAMADSDDQDAIYSDGKSGDTYVLSAPAAPRSFATGDISSNSISFTWVAPVDTGKASTGDATLSGYRFEYKLTNSNTWEDISSVTTGVGVRLTADLSGSAATGVTVEGLQAMTGYDFRISAKNSVGLYGEVASITVGTTSGATSPGDSGDDLTFTEHATNGFTVNWGVGTSGLKADGVTAAPITNYVVEWGTSVNTYASAENAGLTNSYVINKLNTGTQYFVRVRAMADSDDENKIYSDGKSGDTYVLSAPAAPRSFATGDVSSNSISFTWVAPVDTGKASTGDATLSGYRFEYKLTNSNTWEDISSVTTGVGVRLTADLSGSAATGVTVEGLLGKTGYDFRISAKNSVDLYGEVASITVGTTSGATSPGDSVNVLTFTGHATNGFTVNWGVGTSGLKADGVTAAPITNYVVEWGTSVNTYASAENAGLTNSYVINKLNTGTQYFVRVRAMADSDDQDAIYSDGKSGDTYVLSAPAAPRSFATGDVSSNSISFTWVAPVDTGKASTGDATLSGYRFEYKLTNSTTWEDISSVTTGVGVRLTADLSGSAATGVTVEGLLGKTGYDFRISAKNSVDLYGEVASITVGTTSGATSPGDSGDDLTFTGHATNGFTVNWGVGTSGLKADGVTAAPITNYVVEWGTSVNTYASAENAGLTNSYVINKLNTGTQYFVRVRAMADSDDENKIYSDGKSGDTYVLSAPAAPTSFATGDVSSNSISFTWVAPVDTGKASTGDATLSGYRFEYKLTNSNTWEDISSVTTGVGVRLTADLSGSAATGVTVEGLQAMTGYDFRISAKNSVDLYGEVASITVGTTSGATSPGDSGDDLTFTGHATNGFTVNWGVGTSGLKADGVTAAPITNYVVEWGTSVNTYASAENAGLTNSYVINKLNTGTQYFVRVRAMADSDDQDAIYSDGKSGDTYVLSAPAAPRSFATGDVSSNSISFTWVAPVDTGKASTGDATLSGYRFEYKLTNSNTWEDISSVTTGVGVRLTADLSGSAATGVTVEGLLGKTGYDFRISAKNSVGLYGEVASITVGTTSGATSPGDSGDDLTFTGHATNGFTVNWGVGTSGLKADGVTAAPITNYVVEWGTSVNTYASAENAGLTNSYVINKLNTGTQYFVRVRAMADSDDQDAIYSDGKSGDTYVLSAPAAPRSFATGDVSSNSISFTWVAPVDTGKASTGDATLSGYRFEYKLTNSNTWEDISSVTTGVGVRLTADLSGSAATGVTVEGLLGKTGYDFRISAKNSVDLYGEVASITVGTTSGATSPGDSVNVLTFTGHATNGFTVNWGVGTSGLKADGVTAAPITNYVVEWGTSVNTYASAENAGLTNSYVINKLNTGTQYFVRVRAMADSDDENKIYSDGKSGDTYVLSAPAAPRSFATGDVSSNSISFTWVAPVDTGKASTGDATLSGYRFEYKLTNSNTWEDISSVTTGVGVRLTADLSGSAATGVTVEGLLGKMGYDFRISAKNSVDLYGEVASITVGTTSGATSPGDSGDDLTFTEHATNGFTVNWGVGTSGLKADGVTAAPITNYVVEWGTSVNTYASAENAGLTNSYVINKLNTGTQYFVRVRAMADSDDQDAIYSDGKSGDTYVLSAPAAPRSFATGDISSNSISFTWVAPVDTGKASTGDATLSGYRFEYKLTNSNTWEDISSVTTGVGVRLTADLSGSAATGVTVEGLQAMTGYDFRISAKNSVDLYGEGLSITVETTSGASAPVDSADALTFTDHSVGGFTVGWAAATAGVKADGSTSAPVTNYVVEWGTTAGSYTNGGNVGAITSYAISNLSAGTQYFVRVRAIADSDDSSKLYSTGNTGDTYVPTLPGVVSDTVIYSDITTNGFTATWTAPLSGKDIDGSTTLTSYKVEVALHDGVSLTYTNAVGTLNESQASMVITGLTPGSRYHVRVTATNIYGSAAARDFTNTVSLMPETLVSLSVIQGEELIVLSWPTPMGVVNGYDFKYLVGSNGTPNLDVGDVGESGVRLQSTAQDDLLTSTTSVTILGLTTNTRYRFSVAAKNGDGSMTGEAVFVNGMPNQYRIRDYILAGASGIDINDKNVVVTQTEGSGMKEGGYQAPEFYGPLNEQTNFTVQSLDHYEHADPNQDGLMITYTLNTPVRVKSTHIVGRDTFGSRARYFFFKFYDSEGTLLGQTPLDQHNQVYPLTNMRNVSKIEFLASKNAVGTGYGSDILQFNYFTIEVVVE